MINKEKSLIELGKTNPDTICKLFDTLLNARNRYHKPKNPTSFIVQDKYQYHIEIIDEQLDYLIEIMLHDHRELPKSMAMFQPKIRRFDSNEQGAVWLHPYKELARNMLDNNFEELLIKGSSTNLGINDYINIIKENQELKNINRIVTGKIISKNKQLIIERKKTQFKLAYLSVGELEKTADECRFKNGKLNLTKLSDKYGVDPDTVKNEIVRRKLTYLLNPQKIPSE